MRLTDRAFYLGPAIDADNFLGVSLHSRRTGSLDKKKKKKNRAQKKERTRRDELSPSASELLPLVLSPVGNTPTTPGRFYGNGFPNNQPDDELCSVVPERYPPYL